MVKDQYGNQVAHYSQLIYHFVPSRYADSNSCGTLPTNLIYNIQLCDLDYAVLVVISVDVLTT